MNFSKYNYDHFFTTLEATIIQDLLAPFIYSIPPQKPKKMKKNDSKRQDPKDINTSAIINKSRVFRDVTLNLPKCRAAMISILQATAIGVRFSDKEQTELFFSLTQLMHNQDTYIHRLLILLLKQIKINSHDAIIVTHSLSKDITGDETIQQGHAIRCLCSLLDASNVLTLERFLKAAIVSSVPYTASSALCGALRIIEGGRKDAVLRWLPEIKTASKSSSRSVRYHALLLLYALKCDDMHAAAQLANTLESAKSQLEQCISIAISAQSNKVRQNDQAIQLLRSTMKTGAPIVRLESARRCATELTKEACETLSGMIGTSTLRSFAAVRTIAMSPNIKGFEPLLPQILDLMKHPNASLAAMASVCVLRLGNESHVELATKRILKNCRKWATPLIKAVAEEACVFAGKYKSDKLTDVAVLLLKISSDLKSKFSILRALLTTEGIPRAQLLPKLSEYLEDWDSVDVARTICDFIAGQVESLEDPSSLIPVLFNRVNLDVASVRMAALNTLAAIAAKCDGMKERILPLLQLFANDEDDIVREEVILLINALKTSIDMNTIMTEFVMKAEETPLAAPIQEEQVAEAQTTFVPVEMNPEFEKYGKCLWKTDAIDLTERDTEFVVSYFVNVFEKHIVIEFICTNTIEDSTYNNVSVQLEGIDAEEILAAESIGYQQTASMCVVIERSTPLLFGQFKATLYYTPADDEVEDEYELGMVNLDCGVWFTRSGITDFAQAWELTHLLEASQVFIMSKDKNPVKAAKRVEEEIVRLEKLDEEKEQRKLIMCFGGKTIESGKLALIKTEIGSSKTKGIMCRVTVRAESEELCENIINSLAF